LSKARFSCETIEIISLALLSKSPLSETVFGAFPLSVSPPGNCAGAVHVLSAQRVLPRERRGDVRMCLRFCPGRRCRDLADLVFTPMLHIKKAPGSSTSVSSNTAGWEVFIAAKKEAPSVTSREVWAHASGCGGASSMVPSWDHVLAWLA